MPCNQDNSVVLKPRTVPLFTPEAFQRICTLHIVIRASFVTRHSKSSRKTGS